MNVFKMKAMCALCLLASLAALAAQAPALLSADVADQKFAEAIALHDKASEKPDAATIEKARQLLEPLAAKSALAKGYLGSLITIDASLAAGNKNGIKALALLDTGSAMIDEAVASEPGNPDLRFLRMMNGYGVSVGSPVNRFKVVKTDVDWLDARKAQFDAKQQATIELYKGLYLAKARKLEEALDAFDACIALSPGSAEAIEAERQIAQYSE